MSLLFAQRAKSKLSPNFVLPLPLPFTHKKSADFFHTLYPRVTLALPSAVNGWPGPTELWLAEGGEFRCAGAVPAGRKLAKRMPRSAPGPAGSRWIAVRVFGANGRNRLPPLGWRPAAFDPHPVRAASRPVPAASPQMPARHIPAASDGVLCRARVGKGGVRSPKDRTRRNRPGLAPSFAGRRPACARKAHVSLTGGARVNAPSHIFPTTTGHSPAPHRSRLLPDKKMLETDGETFSRAGFLCASISPLAGEMSRSDRGG